jgi:hypothetical protein
VIEVIPVELLDALIAEYLPPDPPRPTPKPAANGRWRGDGRPDNRVERCRAYLRKLPVAVSGQHGHDQTFEAARLIWADFGIDEADGWPLLVEFNGRCEPPWDERDLRRKWDEAVKKGGPRGSKLDGRPDGANAVGRGSRHADRTGVPADPADGERTGCQIILAHFRTSYTPRFRVGAAVHCADGSVVTAQEACAIPDSRLIERLGGATDAPRVKDAVKTQALPAFFKTWARVAWGDLLAELPDEDHAELADDEPAPEQFRRLVREALLAEVTIVAPIDGTGPSVPQRRSLIGWCQQFAKTGPWRDVRGRRCWCKLRQTDGSELVLMVAVRHEVFSQVGGDRRLREMGANTFARRSARYGVGQSCRGDRPHGHAAVVLDEGFVADLLADVPDDENLADAKKPNWLDGGGQIP